MVSRAVKLVVVGEDDGQNAPQRASHRAQQPHTPLDMGLDLFHLIVGQPRGLIEDFAADFQLADVVQEGGGAHVFHLVVSHAQFEGDLCGVNGDAVGVILRELIVRNHLTQDLQYAEIGLAQLAHALFAMFVQRTHGVSEDHEKPGPD